jgi:hypothetical protein
VISHTEFHYQDSLYPEVLATDLTYSIKNFDELLTGDERLCVVKQYEEVSIAG